MGVEGNFLLHFGLPLLLLLASFYGLFAFTSPWKKTFAWCLFQAAWVLVLGALEPEGGAVPAALVWGIGAVGVATAVLLFVFCSKLDPKRRSP